MLRVASSFRSRLASIVLPRLWRILGSRSRRALETSDIRRILILQLQQLGDSIVFTPALRAIRQAYPSAQIDVLCSPVSFELYRKCPYVNQRYLDKSRTASLSSWLARGRLLRELRAQRYDVAIADATQVSLTYALIALVSGARRRIGFDVDYRGFLYTSPLSRAEDVDFVECNLSIAELLGAGRTSSAVECYFDADDVRRASALLSQRQNDGPIIAIHAASNWQSKTWVPGRWAKVADVLSSEYDASIVFVGTSAERPYIDAIIQQMNSKALSVVGQTSLSELGALLSQCQLFIGTDSGPRHIAGAARTPQITLMSSQDSPHRWTFQRQTETVLRTDPPCSPCFQAWCSHRQCMTLIETSTVLNAARLLLGSIDRTQNQQENILYT